MECEDRTLYEHINDRLSEGMNIQGATGLMMAQKSTLKALGAIEH
jgi:hypothetical protein